jgi:SH3-like domain-containing protein
MVVAESRDWRKVRAPNGDEAWVKAQMVDGGSSVMRTRPGDLPLLEKPKAGARTVAYLRSGAVAVQRKHKDGWNQLRAGGEEGWAPADEVWGGGPAPDCKGVRVPAG